jgi:hypothetical protein
LSKKVWTIPALDAIKALDGRIFATLTDSESEVLSFYRRQGRKFDVAVSIINQADPNELAHAKSEPQADEILKRANSTISVTIGKDAAAAWSARVAH